MAITGIAREKVIVRKDGSDVGIRTAPPALEQSPLTFETRNLADLLEQATKLQALAASLGSPIFTSLRLHIISNRGCGPGVWTRASPFKRIGHLNLIVDGMDTRTGQPATQSLDTFAMARLGYAPKRPPKKGK